MRNFNQNGNFGRNFKERLAQSMYGRNGADAFSKFLTYTALIFLLVYLILSKTAFGKILWVIALALLFYSSFRIYSRNLEKRRRENAAYYRVKQKVTGRFRTKKAEFSQRKDFCFFTCPSCKATLRVPRGKGRIQITCRRCGTSFEKKT